VAFSSITFIPSFIKVGQQVQKLKWGTVYRPQCFHGSTCFNKEGMKAKNKFGNVQKNFCRKHPGVEITWGRGGGGTVDLGELNTENSDQAELA
jgi:hypothetical protein